MDQKEYKRQWYERNKERQKIKNKENYQLHKEERKAWQREYNKNFPEIDRNNHLIVTYGITLEEYNLILERQNGLCAICSQPETVIRNGKLRALCVDHDHETGKVRQLLCNFCNTIIGYCDEDIEILLKAVDYLKQWKKVQ